MATLLESIRTNKEDAFSAKESAKTFAQHVEFWTTHGNIVIAREMLDQAFQQCRQANLAAALALNKTYNLHGREEQTGVRYAREALECYNLALNFTSRANAIITNAIQNKSVQYPKGIGSYRELRFL